MSERTVIIRTTKGFYWSAQLNGNLQVTATATVPASWEVFTLVDFGTRVPVPNPNPTMRMWGLRAANGKWVRTDGNGNLFADAATPALTAAANCTWLGVVTLASGTTPLGTPDLPIYGPFVWLTIYDVNTLGLYGNAEIQVIDWPDIRHKPDRRVGLQAPNGGWLSADANGQNPLVARPTVRDVWETFTMRDLGNDQAAFIACNGQFVSADPGGGLLIANRAYIGPTETFTVAYLSSGRVNLIASNGRYVTAEGGGGGNVTNNRTVAAEWESFNLYLEPRPLAPDRPIALQTHDGVHYITAENAGQNALVANRTTVGVWEIFTLKDLGQGRVALLACNGKYVRGDQSGLSLIADQTAVAPTTTFVMKPLGQDRYALQDGNGKYVGADNGGGSSVYNNRIVNADWEAFTFITPFAPPAGNTVYLKADNGQYLARFTANGTEEIRPAWSIPFVVSAQGFKVAIQADNGKWWSRIDHGSYQSIESIKSQIDQFCLFTLVQRGNVIALQADNGKYLCRVRNGSFDRLEAAKSQIDSSCLFAFSQTVS